MTYRFVEEEIPGFRFVNDKPPAVIGREGLGQAAKEVGEKLNPLSKFAAGIGNASLRNAAGLGNLPSLFGFPKMVDQETLDVGKATQEGAGALGAAGNIAANVGTAMGVPGAFATAPRAAAASAALEPEDRGTAAVLGGLLNLGSRLATGSLVTPTETTKKLLDKGIVPTYGQNAASDPGLRSQMIAKGEEKLQSVPFVGDFITNARVRALEDFRKSAMNQAAPPGAKISATGDEGVAQLKDAFKQGYGSIYAGRQFTPDMRMVNDLAAVPQNLSVPLSNKGLKTYWDTVQRVALDRLPQGGLPSSAVKETIESDLGAQARAFQKSLLKEEQDIGHALMGARNALRDSMKRSLPADEAAKLAPLDKAYAQFANVRTAADKAKAQLGAFSPNQLQAAAKPGTALRELADLGQAALPTKVPNSFSADRGMLAGLLGMLGPAATGLMVSSPGVVASGLAPLMYSRPFLRYEMGQWTPELIRQLSPAAAQGLLSGMQQP